MPRKEQKAEWYIKNRDRILARNKQWRANNKLKIKLRKQELYKTTGKDRELKRCFGITLEDYNAMFSQQNGCCAICKRHQSSFKTRLAVDHCHNTNVVRGLLCRDCNTGLGFFKDNSVFLNNALQYIEENKKPDINLIISGYESIYC